MDEKAKKNEEIEVFVILAQRGDSDAFGKLYDLFVNQIYRYVFYRVGEDDAEDITELVFLKTWENINQYRKGNCSFSSWLFRIAHNAVVDHYRARQATDELSDDIEDHRKEADASLQAHRDLDQKLLNKAMAELKDHYKQILVLKYINEFNNEEISHIMGRSQASLRILQFRALKSLKRILGRMGIYEL